MYPYLYVYVFIILCDILFFSLSFYFFFFFFFQAEDGIRDLVRSRGLGDVYKRQGYLILFAPHAFVPQRQYRTSKSPSPPVFFPISTNFTSTLGIPPPSPSL
eukprot:TRINITY_DN377_c0_g1_i6.p1 TRINITY_DN377_c0_g1~~TRINITY_DN377_c0_g1_i6.p1  ORF type:complete len:102 (-),score=21.06 TRINITY_DN377_c0_g1_i6:48-353(-)